MICDIEHTINKYDMIKKGETVAVGVSGGADSVCLLHFLSKIMGEYDITLKAVHVNHNIRGEEAKRDENFVKELCSALGVQFICFNVDVPKKAAELSMSTEECARMLRYECFESVDADKIATAHTLSDSAETVIFNLARGTGLKGVSGIPPKRGKIIRPFIEMTREDVEEYCRKNGLSFVTDSTNLSDDYSRNKIRHNIMPVLREITPGFEKSIGRFTDTATVENDFIEKCAKELLDKSKHKDAYSRKVFLDSHEAVLKRAVAILLSEKMKKDIELRHVELCVRAIKNGCGTVQLAKDLFLKASDDIITFPSVISENKEAIEWETKAKVGNCETPFGKYEVSYLKKSDDVQTDINFFIDADNIDLSKLVLRSRKSGDKFTSIKRKNTKTLKKLFIENKIPSGERHKQAVLSFENEILWVETLGVNSKYVVKASSVNIIKIQPTG